ncbi:hypothetical protein [Treponema sp. J25]|uniref:hypothetical protein n=1 Tax=Treponema sp. J25 TaxID=2094121 RepID=UPI00105357FB|nr:hypothetical protein [Treponema sp. J25]
MTTIYGWKARMRQGTLQEDEGVLSNRERPLAEMLSLLLETRRVSDGAGPQGRLVAEERRIALRDSIEDAVKHGARLAPICKALGIHPWT